ncbi:hypothetical protein ACJX0J_032147, partial [Zea mays]
VTNKNIYREYLLTSSKLEFQRKVKLGYGEIGRRYGLDCIEPWKMIGVETQWKKFIFFRIIVNIFQSNIEVITTLHSRGFNSFLILLFHKGYNIVKESRLLILFLSIINSWHRKKDLLNRY